MRIRNSWNHKRKRILDEDLMQYKEKVELSEWKINIVEEYANGIFEAQLAEKYGVPRGRVSQIIHTYIWHCLRVQR